MVGVVYRHPNSNFLAFQDELFSSLHKLSSCNCPYYILGDFNIDLLKINSTLQWLILKTSPTAMVCTA